MSVGSGLDGVVAASTVIDVLRRHGVAVSLEDGEPSKFVLGKDLVRDVQEFPESVSRQTLHYLSRKFNVPIHHFFNPLEAPSLPDESIQ